MADSRRYVIFDRNKIYNRSCKHRQGSVGNRKTTIIFLGRTLFCIQGMSTGPCTTLYIMHSLAQSLRLTRDSQLSSFSINCRHTTGIMPTVAHIVGSPPLHRVKPPYINLCMGVPHCAGIFQVWSD